jgi:hypothetical protein
LSDAQATDLLQQAQAIQNAIGCNIGSLSAASPAAETDGTSNTVMEGQSLSKSPVEAADGEIPYAIILPT